MGHHLPRIRANGAEVVGISVSAIYAQQAFARSLGIGFPLLSDWGGEVTRSYGVEYDVWKGHVGLAKRSLFLIDRDGILRYSWITEDASVQPDFEALVAHTELLVGSRYPPSSSKLNEKR